MPPDQAFQNISSDQFNNSDQWIFVETAKFNVGCDATQVAPVDRMPVLLRQTKWITAVEFVDGIVVIVLPPYLYRAVRQYQYRIRSMAGVVHGPGHEEFNFVWQKTLNSNVAHVCTPSNAK